MAIKKRTPAPLDPTTEARIEAFGAGAETPIVEPIPEPIPARTPTTSRTPPPTTSDVARTFLIRYPDAELPLLLLEVSHLIDRSQHATVLRALRRGLEAMKADGSTS